MLTENGVSGVTKIEGVLGGIRTDCVEGQLGAFCRCSVEGFPGTGDEGGVDVEGTKMEAGSI
jgi:hypothetical protein